MSFTDASKFVANLFNVILRQILEPFNFLRFGGISQTLGDFFSRTPCKRCIEVRCMSASWMAEPLLAEKRKGIRIFTGTQKAKHVRQGTLAAALVANDGNKAGIEGDFTKIGRAHVCTPVTPISR